MLKIFKKKPPQVDEKSRIIRDIKAVLEKKEKDIADYEYGVVDYDISGLRKALQIIEYGTGSYGIVQEGECDD